MPAVFHHIALLFWIACLSVGGWLNHRMPMDSLRMEAKITKSRTMTIEGRVSDRLPPLRSALVADKFVATTRKELVALEKTRQVVAHKPVAARKVAKRKTRKAEPFDVASATVSNNELSDIRGGFIDAGGMRIDFGLTTRTIVNGVVEREVTINTNGSSTSLKPSELQQVIQIGDKNVALPGEIKNIPGLLTVIQNNVDNTVIQNVNMLNVKVTNLSSYQLQTMVPLLNQGNISSIR